MGSPHLILVELDPSQILRRYQSL